MFEDDWDLDAYHEDIRTAYHQLRVIYPSLGPFRAPRANDSETVKSIFDNLREFMCSCPILFPEFVDWEKECLKGTRNGKENNQDTGKLKRMIDPLISLSHSLKRKLEEAQDDYDDLGEIFNHFNGEVYDDKGVNSWIKDPSAVNPPTPTSNRTRNNSTKSSSSKRSSDEFKETTSPKKAKVTPPKTTPLQINPFVSRPFTKTTSEPKAILNDHRPAFHRNAVFPGILPRTYSTSTQSTEYVEESLTLSRDTSSTTLTSVTPSTSVSIIPAALPTRPASLPIPQAGCQNGQSPAIEVTTSRYTAMLNKLKVKFHFQWELERMISQHETLTWDQIEIGDLHEFRGQSSLDMVHLVDEILRRAETRLLESDPIDATRREISERKAMLLTEVDREEDSIWANDLRGVGNESFDWPYGGKIQYTLSVQLASRGEECTELLSEHISPSQANNPYRVRRSFERNHSAPSGSTRNHCNPPHTHVDTITTFPETRSFPFKFELRPPEMPGKSFRLARRFGSRRCISLKTKDIPLGTRKELQDMLVGRRLIILGRPYRAFWATADGENVMLIEMPEEGSGIVTKGREDESKMPSFQELLYRYNDLNRKPNQAMAKWAARPQILFSDSVPATKVQLSEIQEGPDIVAQSAQLQEDPTTEEILTDGCGLMSESLALRIYQHPSLTLLNGRPSVVQMRVGGSKGLLALMSPRQATQYPIKEILLRDSMIKALSASNYENDPSLLTVDVLKCEALKIGASISSEAIIAMVHNGVPAQVFVKMAEHELDALRDAFLPSQLEGESEDDMFIRIYTSCYGIGGVGMDKKKRMARKEGKSMRAAGLAKGHWTDEAGNDDDEDGNPMTVNAAERFDVDPISGQPNSLCEALMEAVASGFNPATSPYTASKLHHVMENLSKKIVREFKIPVQQSLTAFIVPDSLQLLAPDELFICFSGKGPIDESTQIPIPYLEGEVLAYRSPCKVPTDVRRLKAVFKPELTYLKDCIVLSANSQLCKRSPASYLGGGDYDGDTVTLFWNQDLVQPFKNADDHFAETPENFVEENFDKSVTKGTEFLESIEGLSEDEKIARMQEWLIGGVTGDELTGIYSGLHENAVYTLGYSHPETIRLARMFCHVLDARKSGLRVKPEKLREDKKRYGGDLEWKLWKKGDEAERIRNVNLLRREKGLGSFIMDKLKTQGEAHRTRMMGSFVLKPETLNDEDFKGLAKLWEDVKRDPLMKYIPNWQDQIDRMEIHVRTCSDIRQLIIQGRCGDVQQTYQDILEGKTPITKNRPGTGTYSPTKQQKIESSESTLERLAKIRQLALTWKENPGVHGAPLLLRWNVSELKLSCLAGMVVGKKPAQTCPFDLDYTGFCAMQAKSNGRNFRVTLAAIHEDMKPSNKIRTTS
ncbi:hypothetical protein L486_03881 [Kwoniella mangroviensis CBS 10435]|uniref:RNA-dependent RNA polymerase n=1 Tax=Kwoniella mangroviensis CBS 10435 TaxID=1331196 RepID=A0A1B9IR04_9TREE|nr:hypothetical protein L486_03881 [Kwoniella mangroviensis CBS 10435]